MGFNLAFKGLKFVTSSIILWFITIFTLCMWFPHIAIDLEFVLDMVILYFLAIRFRRYATVRINRQIVKHLMIMTMMMKLKPSHYFCVQGVSCGTGYPRKVCHVGQGTLARADMSFATQLITAQLPMV